MPCQNGPPRYADPPLHRLLIAVCLASLVSAAPVLVLGKLGLVLYPVALLLTAAHIVLLGMPAYLFYHRRRVIDWPQSLVGGLLMGALPIAIWIAFLLAREPEQLGTTYSMGGIWIGVFSLLGAVGGGVFRLVLGEPERDYAGDFDATIFE